MSTQKREKNEEKKYFFKKVTEHQSVFLSSPLTLVSVG